MAYMSQEKKKSLEPKVKEILKKFGLKGRLGVHHHSTLVLNITSGSVDFFSDMVKSKYTPKDPSKFDIQINPYHYDKQFTGKALEFLSEVIPAMNIGNFDDSDAMTDYFHVGWYVDVNIGKWDKPYNFTG